MSWEHLGPENPVWINIGNIELVTPSKSKCHSVLGWNLSESERVEGGDRSSEISQDRVEHIVLDIDIRMMSLMNIIGCDLGGFV